MDLLDPRLPQETSDLQRALEEHFAQTGKFPQSPDELNPVLQAAKSTPERLLDPWGHPYRLYVQEAQPLLGPREHPKHLGVWRATAPDN